MRTCKICEGAEMIAARNIYTFPNGKQEYEYQETCAECGNLCYGEVRNIKLPDKKEDE